MDGRSASADPRRAVAAAACAALALAACTATSPPPLPPRRVDFTTTPAPPPDGAAPGVAWPSDLPAAAEAPDRNERYLGWTLTADILSVTPLLYWTASPKDVYLAAPALLLVPAIHAAHGEARSAGISIAMRAGMLGLAYLAKRWADRQCSSSSGSQEQFCLPFGPLMLLDVAIVVPVVIDSTFLAERQRPASGWDRLPMLGAAFDGDGRRLFTLSARF